MELVVVSGLSGAGKTRAAGVLEDLGFYCVDNLPVALMPRLAELCLAARDRYERVALVTDVRGRDSFPSLFSALSEMEKMGFDYKILYMDADLESIVMRYKETRRRHPLDPDGTDLPNAVRREMEMLAPVRERADYIIDTTSLTLGQLERKLFSLFGDAPEKAAMTLNIVSFGFKYGIPIDADLVFDARFLPNPYYIPELKDLCGLDEPVQKFVFSYEQTRTFMDYLGKLMLFLIPNYIEEGKHSLTVCIGCTGGRHRSVSIAARLRDIMVTNGYKAICLHRDLDRK